MFSVVRVNLVNGGLYHGGGLDCSNRVGEGAAAGKEPLVEGDSARKGGCFLLAAAA